jgi:hypothetical protein
MLIPDWCWCRLLSRQCAGGIGEIRLSDEDQRTVAVFLRAERWQAVPLNLNDLDFEVCDEGTTSRRSVIRLVRPWSATPERWRRDSLPGFFLIIHGFIISRAFGN